MAACNDAADDEVVGDDDDNDGDDDDDDSDDDDNDDDDDDEGTGLLHIHLLHFVSFSIYTGIPQTIHMLL